MAMKLWWANVIIWADPNKIIWKITPFLDLPPEKGGDWDISRRKRFHGTAKYRAIEQRFLHGADWLETDLFVDVYTRRLERDGRVGRCKSLAELAGDYDRRFGGLYQSMKRDGFRTEKNGRPITLPAFLVGRDGEVFIGNQGNHRLAIAQVLGLEMIAGRIVCRHKNWTG